MVASNRVRLVCTECRHKVTGTRGQSERYGCEKCGGQLREVSYGARQTKRYGRGRS